MKTIRLIIITITMSLVLPALAQSPIYLTPGAGEDLLLNHISKESNIGLSYEKTNVKIISGHLPDFKPNEDGLIFISKRNGRILDQTQDDPRLDESLMTSKTGSNANYFISQNGKWLIKEQASSITGYSELLFISASSKQTLNSFSFEGSSTSLVFSNDANTFAFTINAITINAIPSLNLVIRVGDNFQSKEVFNAIGSPKISSSGDRVFTVIELEDESRRHVVIDKSDEGWSEPKSLTLYDQDLNELEYGTFGIIDVAENGRTLLINIASGPLAIYHEKDGAWGLPEYLDIEKQSPFSNSFSISEDGNVILFESFRVEDGFYEYFDLFLYIKQENGEWKKQKLNPDGVDASRGAILTKDGSKVFWIPWQTLSSVEYDVYK